jgi:hypothetical protein
MGKLLPMVSFYSVSTVLPAFWAPNFPISLMMGTSLMIVKFNNTSAFEIQAMLLPPR